ncbi:MAG: hypothetical protein HYX75_04535 [Acidobacteria bacterium]|nr:hypothetical protein [Acidobacteriota bacterium]
MPITPIIVLGIGGTGMKALLQLKRMIAESRAGGLKSLPAVRLLCIDSDDLIRPKASPDPHIAIEDISLDPVNEFLKLDIPGNVSYADLDRARSWFPKELEYYIPDLSTGCKQYKPLGRLLFGWNYPKVLKLVEPLRDMVDSALLRKLGVTQVEDPMIFIVSSLCGGTGAGMFLDAAYMQTNLWKRKWSRFNTKVCGLLALPSVFADITQASERIRSNAYASMKELDHFMNKDVYMDPERAFRSDYPYVEHPEVYQAAPFDRVFLFDNSNGRVSVSSAQIYEMMARYIYLMACGELTQEYNSLDNNLNPTVRGTHRLLNKPTCYSSFGYYSVVFPKRTALQLVAADLALDLVQEELASATDQRAVDQVADAFLTACKMFFGTQSPQILHSLSQYTNASGERVNIQDTISGTIANIDLSAEQPENFEGILREYDTRLTNTDLALFEADCRRDAQELLRAFRAKLELQIQELADPSRKGSVFQAHLFLEELAREVEEDIAALTGMLQQTETQLPGLKSALETQLLKIREAGASRSLLTRINLRRTMAALLEETKERFESFWLARRKATILQNAIAVYKGDPSSREPDLRSGALESILRERDHYRAKVAVLERARERFLETIRARRSVAEGDFTKIVFDYTRDIEPMVQEVKARRGALAAVRAQVRSPGVFGPDLDGLTAVLADQAILRLSDLCAAAYQPVVDAWSLDECVAGLGDVGTLVKTWLNFSRPFLMLDSVDASKYGFGEEHNAARFIAIPHTYVGKPCEQILNRCPVSGVAECDRWPRCLKRAILEVLPRGTSVGHMAGRHEIHFLSLYHGVAASSLIHLISESAAVYRNHLLASEKIHMFGPLALYDLREPLPNKTLERMKDLFYLSFATGSIAWDDREEVFRFRADADVELKLPPSIPLGADIVAVLDNFHSHEGVTAQAVAEAFTVMDRRIVDRCRSDARGLGQEALTFIRGNDVPLDDDEKRRLYSLGKELAEGRCNSI